jgi:hypothetical protein
MKAYYAHHIWKYNTKIEDYEISLIPFDVINPKDCIDQTKSEKEIMQDCFDLISSCDAVVFSSLSGVVGKGVLEEIMYAFDNKKKVFYICGGKIIEVNKKELRIAKIKESETKRIYAEIEVIQCTQ